MRQPQSLLPPKITLSHKERGIGWKVRDWDWRIPEDDQTSTHPQIKVTECEGELKIDGWIESEPICRVMLGLEFNAHNS
jgi:hypothetical protein